MTILPSPLWCLATGCSLPSGGSQTGRLFSAAGILHSCSTASAAGSSEGHIPVPCRGCQHGSGWAVWGLVALLGHPTLCRVRLQEWEVARCHLRLAGR